MVYNLSDTRIAFTIPESPVHHGTIPSTVEGEEPIIAHDAPVSAPASVPTAMEAIKSILLRLARLQL
jgi:hypothetical protein